MSRILIAGLGNELRGDDAAGLLAVRALRGLAAGDIDVVEHSGDAASLAESMLQYQEIVVIDAVAAGSAPGTVVRMPADSPSTRSSTSSHGPGLRQAIALSHALGASPNVRIFGITGRTFELGAAPSPEVVTAASEVAAEIREMFACA